MKKKASLGLTPDSSGRSPTLNELLRKAELHRQAESQVMSALPPQLQPGTRFVSCHEGELTLSTETATAATQLRYRQHEIMAALRENDLFRFVWKLTVKVKPARFSSQSSRTMSPLSNENARLLKEEAGHTKDKKLREVLEKLASHTKG
ncbi:DUF721 domain-containing protein [Marinobacter zhejiangensis]|uniref:DUF721 domain-containing protein n=1 Tax=Marinobacter zhejiangensis TaxID=488535 RepID=A0A1I4TBQ7_9GAMM|nr:DciA family protein [Marinobacter zhejiangensis]SFM74116.1 hypothetical protein SAMN04487963_3544 [Marinobacter zhejiangensis]